jgi:DNA polymerase-3 subunit gamma/tau
MAKKAKDETTAAEGATAPGYVVLARKYRPRTFDDLIGQEALVTTLRNAFAAGRIAQAYMLTGVRGIGKTTTARILARALNYEADGVTGPTVNMPVLGRHCVEIMESRHPDVIEMDAASNTSVDDVREIIENARYRPLSARYKVFIIDEVHMLSKNAFNALLKTLEEPPEHVKFVFATTEIRKVPVTVLSRCQRFDLRRIDADVLVGLFKRILDAEGAAADEGALRLIARAAEGSARDGLSILDQAIAMGSGEVAAADVRAMLGLADRSRIFDLLEHVLSGRAAEALKALSRLNRDGAEALQVLADLGECVHLITRTKIAGAESGSDALAAEERARAATLASELSVPILSRAWQMLLKGIEETAKSGQPLAAAEMLLVRMAHTADLPAPDEIIRALGGTPTRPASGAMTGRETGSRGALNQSRPAGAPDESVPPAVSLDDYGQPAAEDAPAFVNEDDDLAEAEAEIGPSQRPGAATAAVDSFQDVVDLAGRRRDVRLKVHLEDHVSLVRFDAAQGLIELHLLAAAPKEIGNDLRVKLSQWTGRRWMVALSPRPGERPLGEVQREAAARDLERLKSHPAVAEVLRHFPNARVASVARLPKTDADDSAAG